MKICCRFNLDAAELLPLWTVFNDPFSTGKNLHGCRNWTSISSSRTDASRSRPHLRQALHLVDGWTKVFVWKWRGKSADPFCLEQGDFAAHQRVASGLEENSKRIIRLKSHYLFWRIFLCEFVDICNKNNTYLM